MTLFSQKAINEGTTYLDANDPVLASVIKCTAPLKSRNPAPPFETLCKITIGQQLSGTVADRIYARIAALPDMQSGFDPNNLLTVERHHLKNCGLSSQKADFLIGFANILVKNSNAFDEMAGLQDSELIEKLMTIRGIGPWTAAIFSMSAYGRLNIFPHGDVTIKKCIEKLYHLDFEMEKKATEQVIERWTPYRSVAVSHLWNWYDEGKF
jgi:DNA-3-methyladenine glycosylase II